MQTQTPKVRYQALGPLMSGEGSRAFLGLEISDVSPARPVVMVWVPGDTARDAEKRAQILRETQRAVTLEHPNITRVYGLASLDEGLARVVEFSDGESLRRVLEVAHRLPPSFAARVTIDAATGLHFAHMAGNDDGSPLLHGDIRPETVMVSYGGVSKVGGYGALSVAPKEIDGKRVKRRRLYCAPEQIIGGRNAISVQTDVYLLGLIFFECLTGHIPYENEENFEQAVLEKPLSLEGLDIPAPFVPILVRATAKRAAERFPTALAFREELEKAVTALPPMHRLSTHQEFSGYLQAFFPDEDPARVARRQTIDAGLADHARRTWEKKSEERPGSISGTGGTVPPNAAISSTSVPVTAAPAAVAPAAASFVERRSRPAPLQVASISQKRRSLAPLWVAGLVAVLAVGVYAGTQLTKPTPPLPTRRHRPVEQEAQAVGNPATVPPTGTTAVGTVPATGTAASPPTPVPTTTATKPVEPVASTTVATAATSHSPAAPSQLELNVTPAVNVSLNGKALGRTPLTVNLPPGHHTLRLSDSEKGINVTRAVTINRGGITRHFMELGKGLLTIHIPDGAVINLDGKNIGNQSIRDLSVYEGSHHLVVVMNGAKWQQAFTLAKDQSMEYEVHSEAQR